MRGVAVKHASKLVNRRCGHVASYGDRDVLDAQRQALSAAGHHDWRVRLGSPGDLAVFLHRERCGVCQVDPALLGMAAT